MNEQEVNFFSIIPANVRYDTDLLPQAKLLYAEITALINLDGYCIIENKYFANLYGMSENCVKRLIEDLNNKKYISVCLSNNRMQISLNEAESANAHYPNIL